MTGDPASTLYDYADSISLDAQFHLVDTISGTDLNQTKIIDLCESAAASATCAIGDGATTSELKLLQLLDRTDTYRELMAETAIAPWYERMQAAVGPGSSCTSRQ